MQNLIAIATPQELGRVIRSARKWQHLRQDEVGRFSHSFIGEVETGKPTAQVGRIFQALRELGIKFYLELPNGMPSMK